MRGLRSTLLLAVVLIGLVAYIWLVDSKAPVGEAEKKDTAFAAVTADDIEELSIKSADGETSHLKKSDGTWKIVEPVSADVDAGEVSSITSALSNVDIQRVVDEKPADLKRFGLDPPRIEVEFRAKGQKTANRLLVGDKTPTGSDLYARTPDKARVFLVSSYLDSTFNKNTFALRDKRILKFDREKVEGLELTDGRTTQQFAKAGMDWRIAKPIAARADFGTVEGIVERLASAQMQKIVAPEAADLKQYGLDKPSATLIVTAGSARATLLLGKTEDAVIYAKDASRPVIFTVAPTIKTDAFKDIGDVRRKDLFDARSFSADRIEITRDGMTLAFEKTKGKDNMDVWKNAAGAEMDTAKMDDLLSKVTGLRADSFATGTHPSLKTPTLTVNVRFDQGKMETVSFGRAGMDVFAARPDEPGYARLTAMALDEANTAIDAAQEGKKESESAQKADVKGQK